MGSQVFGKKTVRSEAIDKIITYDYLNDSLRQRLRDKFGSSLGASAGGASEYKSLNWYYS